MRGVQNDTENLSPKFLIRQCISMSDWLMVISVYVGMYGEAEIVAIFAGSLDLVLDLLVAGRSMNILYSFVSGRLSDELELSVLLQIEQFVGQKCAEN